MLSELGHRQVVAPSATRRFPLRLSARMALRGALCLPYLALAGWAAARGIHTPIQLALAREGASVRWGSTVLTWIANAYPPIPVAIASLASGSASLLGVAGALAAGGVLQLAWERLREAELAWWAQAAVLVAIGATPVFGFVATEDLSGFLGLALFSFALAGLVEFLLEGRTRSGFVAGIALGLAACCDPSALLYVASGCVAVPLLLRGRPRWPGVTRSAIAVLVFPSLAALCGWAFFEWRFTGTPYHALAIAPEAFSFPHGVLASARTALAHLGVALGETPLFLVSAIVLVARRPLAGLALVLVPLDLGLSFFFGLGASMSEGLVLLAVAATLGLPRPLGRRAGIAVVVASATQVVLWVSVAMNDPGLSGWWHALLR
jgi:hypothetical protein